MPALLRVSKQAVRRFLLDVQGLWEDGPTKASNPEDVLGIIRNLECVQIDPVAAVERNQHLVLFARNRSYQPAALDRLLSEGKVFEYWAHAMCVIPMDDYPIFEVIRRRMRTRLQAELDQLGPVADEVLRRLEAEGPLPAKAFESTHRVNGYWDNGDPKTKATSHALNLLNDTGRIQVVRREGTTRFFDIRERAVPDGLLEQAQRISDADALAALLDKYVRAYRVFDAADPRFGWCHMTAGERRDAVQRGVQRGTLVPLEIEGVKRPYFILAEDVDRLLAHAAATPRKSTTAAGPIRFLPPLDNLLWRRERIEDLFDFSYTWEVYIPRAKRRYGYYAMPILVGDTLIGRIDPRLDRSRAQLDIQLLQLEPGIRSTKRLHQRMLSALETFARFHQAQIGNIEIAL